MLLEHYDNTTEGLTSWSFDPVNPFDLEMAAMVTWLRERKQGRPSVIDGYNVDLVIQEIERSDREGCRLPLEWLD